MRSTRRPRAVAQTLLSSTETRKGKPSMQTQYAQRHQVARAGFSRVSAPAFPVCAMGIASWSNVNTLDITTGKPGSPRPPSVSLQ
jgi:hypothetical protein